MPVFRDLGIEALGTFLDLGIAALGTFLDQGMAAHVSKSLLSHLEQELLERNKFRGGGGQSRPKDWETVSV